MRLLTAFITMPYFYAVRVGRKPGVYVSWPEAQAQVNGFQGAIHKKFSTINEANVFLNSESLRGLNNEQHPITESVSAIQAAYDPLHDKSAPDHSFILYTDGSCKGNFNVHLNKSPAGWGVVVLKKECLPITQLIPVAELFGPVIIDPSSDYSLGAEVGSNNTGELCAIGEGLLWLQDAIPSTAPATICYDSEYAAKSVQGMYNSVKNLALIHRIQEIFKKVSVKRSIQFVHVKGHSNDFWNDRADELANRGAAGDICDTGRFAIVKPMTASVKSNCRQDMETIDLTSSNKIVDLSIEKVNASDQNPSIIGHQESSVAIECTWTEAEDAGLWNNWTKSVSALASSYGKSEGAVRSRLLQLDDPEHSAYQRLHRLLNSADSSVPQAAEKSTSKKRRADTSKRSPDISTSADVSKRPKSF